MEIMARLTADAVVKKIKNDKQVISFNVAINDSYNPKDGNRLKKMTMYMQSSYWVNTTIAPYLTKGTLVGLYGRIGVNAYNNWEGEAKAGLTFHVNNIKLHGGGKANNATKETVGAVPITANELTEPLDDLPF